MRKLGMATVLDRFIQRAVVQVLQRRWDRTFSERSCELRPGRFARQRVAQAQEYIPVPTARKSLLRDDARHNGERVNAG
jgi:retron-type reverse transcriptase